MNTTVTAIAKECIPNRCIKIKPSEPPWITTDIKRNIRKRKRAYKKVKRTNSESDWKKFKTLRNKVVQNIRDSKKLFYDKISTKLTSENLSSKDWWTTLKTFIAPNSKTSIPPLEFNDTIYTEDNDKANVLNSFFQSHTILNEQNAIIPTLPAATVITPPNNIILSPLEVESVLKTFPLVKATGPNGLSNRILRELSKELSIPYCSLFNQSLRAGIVPSSYKEANVCPVPKKSNLTDVTNYRPISLLNSEDKVLERFVFKYLLSTYVALTYFPLYNPVFFQETQPSTS